LTNEIYIGWPGRTICNVLIVEVHEGRIKLIDEGGMYWVAKGHGRRLRRVVNVVPALFGGVHGRRRDLLIACSIRMDEIGSMTVKEKFTDQE
jgi:hypothetical protein